MQSFVALRCVLKSLRHFWTLKEVIPTTKEQQLEWLFGTRHPGTKSFHKNLMQSYPNQFSTFTWKSGRFDKSRQQP